MADRSIGRPTNTSGLERNPKRELHTHRAEAPRESEARVRIAALLREKDASPGFIYAFEKTGTLVMSLTRLEWSAAHLKN